MQKKRKAWKVALLVFGIVIILVIGGVASMIFFGVGKFENIEPKIVTLDKPIYAVGMGTKVNLKTVFKDIPKVGTDYKRYKDKNGIPNKVEPWSFVAMSKDYNEIEKTWDYAMGDVVNDFSTVPDGLTKIEIPAGKYAVFPIRPKNKFVWGFTISKMKEYVMQTWFPKSQYEATGMDFEFHDERSLQKKPEIDLYFALKDKK